MANPQDARIAAVTAWVRRFCGWHIAPSVTETITVNGSGTRIIALPTMHLTDVASVTEHGRPVPVEWTEVGLIRHPGRWSDSWRSVEVEFTHGFDEAPADLVSVIIDAALRMPTPGEHSIKKVGPFELGASADVAFLPSEMETLGHFQIWTGARA